MKKSISMKAVVLLLVAVLLIGSAIGGTLAWLVAESDTVTNTFTYGKIEIELEETKGTDTGNNTREFGNIVPGDTVEKDPTVTVLAGSEKCYVYVLIDNQLGTAASYDISAANWTIVGKGDTKVLYRYNGIVDATSAAKDLPVFTTLTFSSTLDNAAVTALKDKNVVITAYAHQADKTTEAVADAAAITWAGVTAIS